MPVQVATARLGNLPVDIAALGTVTARKTVTLTPRVDGLLQQVFFHEGQVVKANQVLEQIDPRPFQVVVDQWAGQLMHDQALLDDARLDLVRYQGLLARNSVAGQQVDTQTALVHQYEGTVAADKAQWANAKLQLDFTRVTAPTTGRVGLRLVDAGNMVHASGTAGLVVITQTQPIDVVFPIPEDSLGAVMQVLQSGRPLAVAVYDRANSVQLATGKLMSADNLVDVTTGTIKLKAAFANTDERLFPNEFVNVHLQLGQPVPGILVPVAAVQTGPQGLYVYVVGKDHVVQMRAVKQGPVSGETAEVLEGLAPGELVVIDGVDRLRNGSKVTLGDKSGAKGSGQAGGVRHHKPAASDGGNAAQGKA